MSFFKPFRHKAAFFSILILALSGGLVFLGLSHLRKSASRPQPQMSQSLEGDTDPVIDILKQCKPCSLEKLTSAIQAFNEMQNQRFLIPESNALESSSSSEQSSPSIDLGLDYDGSYPHPEGQRKQGYTQLLLSKEKDFHHILRIVTMTDHTESMGIDDGEDTYSDYFIDPRSFQLLSNFDGPSYASFGSSSVRIALPSRMSCRGFAPQGKLSVYNIQTGQSYFNEDLPEGAVSASIKKGANENQSVITVNAEIADEAHSETVCEASSPAIKREIQIEINCSNSTCHSTRKVISESAGCFSVGGCD